MSLRLTTTIPYLPFFYLLLSAISAFGQIKNPADTLKLPFAIAKEKRLSDDDLAEKKEGLYFTAEPDLSSDPETGFGAGVEGQFFLNGKRTDPFFAYTPYRAEIDLSVYYTTKSERELEFAVDVPYIFNSKWRLRARGDFEVDPDYLYFGTTEKTLKPLSYYPNNDSTKSIVNNAAFNDYTDNQTGSIANYNAYQQEEELGDLSVEHSWFQGKFRTLLGYELAYYNSITPLNNNSLLHEQYLEGLITGYGRSRTALLQLGLIYDTRDLEDDPGSGMIAELTNEYSTTALGSQFNYNRTFFHLNYYHLLFPRTFKKFVFAGRVGMGYTSGNAPFFEYMDQWTSSGDIDALGGPQTLRGYSQGRFAAPAMAIANIELRFRFWQVSFLEQHLGFYAIPFFDAGGVWDNLGRVVSNLQNFRFSEGPGAQIAWNEDTILRFDYGFCPEGNQFYFSIGQIF